MEVLSTYGLNKHVWTKQQALELLRAEFINESPDLIIEGCPVPTVVSTTAPKTPEPEERPLKTTRKSIFDDILSYSANILPELNERKTLLEEIEDYIQEPNLPNSSSELVYWRRNQQKFSKLSFLAKKYLSVPASSGGVERLFSIAGSLARARRNRITPKMLETILIYREWRIRKSSV